MAPRKPLKRCGTCPQRRRYTGTDPECPICRKWSDPCHRARYLEQGCPDEGPHTEWQRDYRSKGRCVQCGKHGSLLKDVPTCAVCRGTSRPGTRRKSPRKDRTPTARYADGAWRHGERSAYTGAGREDGSADE